MSYLIFILGTRPEAIKLAPLILLAQQNQQFKVKIVLTSQHPEMCQATLESFGIVPTDVLDSFENEQGLVLLSSRILLELTRINIEWESSTVIIQGDTTSAIMGAYAGFLLGSKIVHIEAGLRSHNRLPFPEETNRKLISILADLNFCATTSNAENLKAEGVSQDKIFVVGNTVIDAILHFGSRSRELEDEKRILITLHRRENQGSVIKTATEIISKLANKFNYGHKWIFIKHPNPNVQSSYDNEFTNNLNIEFRDPIPYPQMIQELRSANLLITDSGGFQEEATFLGLPTLVLRASTERIEAVEDGSCLLVPHPSKNLDTLVTELLEESGGDYARLSKPSDVFGVGNSAEKIMPILQDLNLGIPKS